jgi:hypothetical protein
MPTLTREQARDIGGKLADLMAPFPRDERLLLLIAGFYGECKAQGKNADQMIEFATRIIKIHERGVLPVQIVLEDTTCPTCGGVL